MSDKKEIQEPGLETEKAKELELDEKPKPTRKVSHSATPISNKEEPSNNKIAILEQSLSYIYNSGRVDISWRVSFIT